jgi:hypothetical protein
MVSAVPRHTWRPLSETRCNPDARIAMARTNTTLRCATRGLAELPTGGGLKTFLPILAVSFLCAACQALGTPDVPPTPAPATVVTPLPAVPASPILPRATPAPEQRATPPAATPAPAASPVLPAKIEVVQAPGTLAPGDTATVIARVPSGTSCSLLVGYKDSSLTVQDLAPIQPETPDLVAWSWQVGPQAPRGEWPLTIVCGALSATVSITVLSR